MLAFYCTVVFLVSSLLFLITTNLHLNAECNLCNKYSEFVVILLMIKD